MNRIARILLIAESLEQDNINVYNPNEKYHQIIPEVKTIQIDKLKRMNWLEVSDVSKEQAEEYKQYLDEPIEVTLFSDGEMRISNGHHRVSTAKKLGIKELPVILQAINAKGKHINELIAKSK